MFALDPIYFVINFLEWIICSDINYMQFGGGSHICIGKHLALFELNKVLPQIFLRYEIKLVNTDHPLRHVTQLFYNQKGLQVTLKKRDIA